MTSIYPLYRKLQRLPVGGNFVFSKLLGAIVPYFSTVRPRFQIMEPGRAVLTIKKRRAVHNHIKTVHVIAICNGLEAAMGMAVEASIPDHLRWLPKGMTVEYPAKANSNIRAEALLDVDDFKPNSNMDVNVTAYRDDGTVVVQGVITIWVTEKPRA
ncbi:MAG: hotdog fold domain-containing protein [Pseudomonadota bacterium]